MPDKKFVYWFRFSGVEWYAYCKVQRKRLTGQRVIDFIDYYETNSRPNRIDDPSAYQPRWE